MAIEASVPEIQLTPRGVDTRAERGLAGDIADLILASQARIARLFTAVEDAARCVDPGRARRLLREAWDRAAVLVEAHCAAAEEICYPVLRDDGNGRVAGLADALADHDDIRAAVAETRLHPVASAAWWRAVNAVVGTSHEHFAGEETAAVAALRRRLPPEQRAVLGRQWAAFMTAWMLDAGPDRDVPGASAAGASR